MYNVQQKPRGDEVDLPDVCLFVYLFLFLESVCLQVSLPWNLYKNHLQGDDGSCSMLKEEEKGQRTRGKSTLIQGSVLQVPAPRVNEQAP